jgi:carbazole 1,9a-dioxygenase
MVACDTHRRVSSPKTEDAEMPAPASKPWQPYLEAELGFRNHWYPACYSHELAEGETGAETLLGERLLLKRIDGAAYAVQDRCLHRGVPFSVRPECYSKNTISCWYHGFTYDVRDGSLVAVITDPESSLIGKLRLRTYPVQERKGLIFVFIGDVDPPALELDLQPGFLDGDLAIHANGERQLVHSNWRLAAENGFDAAHIYIHRDSLLIISQQRPLPLATILSSREGMIVADEGKPKGVMKGSGARTPVWEVEIEGVKVTPRFLPGPDSPRSSPDTSMWLPCGLKVDPFPTAGIMQFEWYVPVDEHSHSYFVTWGRRVSSDREASEFANEMDGYWKALVVDKFNMDDVVAREAMERFYAEEGGWQRERLYRPDIIITEWRKLASAHNRGIQRRAEVR